MQQLNNLIESEEQAEKKRQAELSGKLTDQQRKEIRMRHEKERKQAARQIDTLRESFR